MKIAYLVDTSFLTPEEANSDLLKRIHKVPFVVTSPDQKEYFTDKLDVPKVIELMKKFPKEGFKTSLTPVGTLQSKLEELIKDYDYVIGVPIAKAISNQYSSFFRMTNEEKFKGKFFVVGNRNCSYISYFEMLVFDQILKDEKELTNDKVQKLYSKVITKVDGKSSILVSSFDRLIMSGRVGKLKGTLGNLLGVKANVKIETDGLVPTEKGRSILKVLKGAVDGIFGELSKTIENGMDTVFFMPFGLGMELEAQVLDFLKETYKDKKIIVSTFPLVVSIHIGQNSIGLSCVRIDKTIL